MDGIFKKWVDILKICWNIIYFFLKILWPRWRKSLWKFTYFSHENEWISSLEIWEILGYWKMIEFNLKSRDALECARRYIGYLLTCNELYYSDWWTQSKITRSVKIMNYKWVKINKIKITNKEISKFDVLSRELRKYGYRAAHYPLTQVRQLSKLKDPISKLSKPGVYMLKCIHVVTNTLARRIDRSRSDLRNTCVITTNYQAAPPRILHLRWPDTAMKNTIRIMKFIHPCTKEDN